MDRHTTDRNRLLGAIDKGKARIKRERWTSPDLMDA